MVSIIVPCYNMRAYINDALESILTQTYQDWECVVVDDGSTDGSASIAKEFALKDNRFRVLGQPNSGVSIARNNGVRVSSGEYLLFLDADDQIMPGFLLKAVHILESRPDVKLVYGPAEQFGKGIKTVVLPLPEFSMEAMVGHNCIYVTALFRRVDFDRSGGFCEEFVDGLEDWDLWLSILENGGEVIALEEPAFRYRYRHGSRNRVVSDDSYISLRRLIWERHKQLYSKYFLDPRDSREYYWSQYYLKKYSSLLCVRLYLKMSSLFHRIIGD